MSDPNTTKSSGIPYPIQTMIVVGLLSGVIVGLSFVFVPVIPLPQATVPMFDFKGGFIWGLVCGGITGLVMGFLTDDKHFPIKD